MRMSTRFFSLPLAGTALAALLLAGCATTMEPEGPPRKELIYAVTAGSMELIKFNAGQPRRILERKPITGLAAGEQLVGIDYRVARGVLYALSTKGQLYTLGTASGALTAVGTPSALPLTGSAFGFDFNPAADRIRVVSHTGQNLRLHPDTGAAVDGDPNTPGLQGDGPLAYVAGDPNAGKQPEIVAAGYTYNKQDEKITTNYAIDRKLGVLVMQGSKEGTTPVVSPNTGQLRTVGSLGLGELIDASLDIADVSNAAFAVVRSASEPRTRLMLIDLNTGKAQFIGTVGDGAPLAGMAIEP